MPAKKRTGATAAVANLKEDVKKPRIDPKLVPVTNAILNVEHLPEKCKDMLIAILAPSLKVGSSAERHEYQNVALGLVDETLQQEKSRIQERVEASEQKLENLKSTKAEKDGAAAAAEAVLAVKKEQEQAQKTLLAETSEAKRSAEKALSDAQEAKANGGKTFEANMQEKDLLETAFTDHYKTPMDADEGPHYAALQPLLGKLTLDESLLSALPSSCVKLKDQRGSFDNVVLEELQKAFSTKISELRSMLEAEEPAAAERDAKVQAMEKDLEAKKTSQKEAVSAFDAAQKAVKEAEQEVAKASTLATGAAADIQVEVQTCDALKQQLAEFEAGPLVTFTALKEPQQAPLEKVEAAEEVASAGA